MFEKKEHKVIKENELSGSINLIGQGTTITGDLSCKGDIRIDGVIIGNVISKAKVVIGTTGKVVGDIIGLNADISGDLKGDLTVTDTIFLKSSARIEGDMVTNKLIVESGAIFSGHCNMGISSEKGYSSKTKTDKSLAEIEEN
jgi:cytoskeletal protein CcmA (bactofilin family)